MDSAVILSACRTPIGSFGGVFRDLSAADLGAVVIREAIRRGDVQAADLGDVIMGCVLQAGAGMNVARQAAIKAGAPVAVAKDEYPRAGTTAEKLAALKAAFTKEGTVTAGNASGINDGAAALVIATESWAKKNGRKPLARILSYCTVGVDPMVMGI